MTFACVILSKAKNLEWSCNEEATTQDQFALADYSG